MNYVAHQRAEEFIRTLKDGSVELICTDPPYSGITKDDWDNQWSSPFEYAKWLTQLFVFAYPKLTPTGSLVFFGGIGEHGNRPLIFTMAMLERESPYTYRNWITWKKRRAYGKSHDYLFCREEILWYSKSKERTEVVFNIPYLEEKRGYAGFDERYPAKSEYKRVSNVWTDFPAEACDVWDDIPELMRPRRSCEKPIPLMKRLIATHSSVNALVVDCFAGSGSTGVAAFELGRMFMGCDSDPAAVHMANERIKPVADECFRNGAVGGT